MRTLKEVEEYLNAAVGKKKEKAVVEKPVEDKKKKATVKKK